MIKINILKKIIYGFAVFAVFMLVISVLGWYTAEKTHKIHEIILKSYEMKLNMLECRREEKNILLREITAEHVTNWGEAFDKVKKIESELAIEGFIDPDRNIFFKESLAGYEKLFRSYVNEIKDKKAAGSGELTAYDGKFKYLGREIIDAMEKVIKDIRKRESKLESMIFNFSLSFSAFGILFSLFLGYMIIRNVNNSIREIKRLNDELEKNSLELAIGLSENFEVMRKVAESDFKVKAPENSNNELLSKLGNVINRTIEKLIDISRRELEQVYILSGYGIRVINREFHVIRTNRAMNEILGLAEEKALGTKCYEQFRSRFCHTDQCTLKQILNGKEEVEVEVEKQRIDGKRIECLLKAMPVRNKDGELIGIVEEFTDFTEFKNIQNELEENNIAMAIGLSEIFEVLNKVTKGDFEARVVNKSENELFSKLGEKLNKLIISIKEINKKLDELKH